jgi:hypothetical protein
MSARPSPPPAPKSVRRPPTARYQELIERLAEASRPAAAGYDNLAAAHLSLIAVITFIDSDEDVHASGITRHLRQLAGALRDLLVGAKPPLLIPAPRRSEGRPTDVSLDVLRALVAALADALIRSGQLRQAAGRLVADELRRRRIRYPTIGMLMVEKSGPNRCLTGETE